MTSVADFYSNNPLDVWKQVLGPSMHYHVGGDEAVRNLYPHIPNNSKILDIGCGWGGPATMLHNEKACNLHGVTNSEQQHIFYPYDSTLADANTFIPTQHYDITLFIESFCHLTPQVLNNIRAYTNKVIIRDYLWEDEWYNPVWKMYMRPQQSYHSLLDQYTITHSEVDTTSQIYNSSLFWYNNISTLPSNQITHQIETLYSLTSAVLNAGPDADFIKLITIVAE